MSETKLTDEDMKVYTDLVKTLVPAGVPGIEDEHQAGALVSVALGALARLAATADNVDDALSKYSLVVDALALGLRDDNTFTPLAMPVVNLPPEIIGEALEELLSVINRGATPLDKGEVVRAHIAPILIKTNEEIEGMPVGYPANLEKFLEPWLRTETIACATSPAQKSPPAPVQEAPAQERPAAPAPVALPLLSRAGLTTLCKLRFTLSAGGIPSDDIDRLIREYCNGNVLPVMEPIAAEMPAIAGMYGLTVEQLLPAVLVELEATPEPIVPPVPVEAVPHDNERSERVAAAVESVADAAEEVVAVSDEVLARTPAPTATDYQKMMDDAQRSTDTALASITGSARNSGGGGSAGWTTGEVVATGVAVAAGAALAYLAYDKFFGGGNVEDVSVSDAVWR